MRFQSHQSSCGPASVANALLALGIVRSEQECGTLCKTTVDGTTPLGITRGLRQVPGIEPSPIRETRADVALLRLAALLRGGRPAILCVDNFGHWVAAVGMLGDRFLIADPADNELVLALDSGALLERWEGDSKPYFVGVML